MDSLKKETPDTSASQDLLKVRTLSEEQRLLLCDLGVYNDVMKGYLIKTLEFVGYDDGVICQVLNCLERALDDNTAKEALEAYHRFFKFQKEGI